MFNQRIVLRERREPKVKNEYAREKSSDMQLAPCRLAVDFFTRCIFNQFNTVKPSDFIEINLQMVHTLFVGRKISDMGLNPLKKTRGIWDKMEHYNSKDYASISCEENIFDWLVLTLRLCVDFFIQVSNLPDDDDLIQSGMTHAQSKNDETYLLKERVLKIIVLGAFLDGLSHNEYYMSHLGEQNKDYVEYFAETIADVIEEINPSGIMEAFNNAQMMWFDGYFSEEQIESGQKHTPITVLNQFYVNLPTVFRVKKSTYDRNFMFDFMNELQERSRFKKELSAEEFMMLILNISVFASDSDFLYDSLISLVKNIQDDNTRMKVLTILRDSTDPKLEAVRSICSRQLICKDKNESFCHYPEYKEGENGPLIGKCTKCEDIRTKNDFENLSDKVISDGKKMSGKQIFIIKCKRNPLHASLSEEYKLEKKVDEKGYFQYMTNPRVAMHIVLRKMNKSWLSMSDQQRRNKIVKGLRNGVFLLSFAVTSKMAIDLYAENKRLQEENARLASFEGMIESLINYSMSTLSDPETYYKIFEVMRSYSTGSTSIGKYRAEAMIKSLHDVRFESKIVYRGGRSTRNRAAVDILSNKQDLSKSISTLRVGTYNVHFWMEENEQTFNHQRILDLIRLSDVDVLGLQEVVISNKAKDPVSLTDLKAFCEKHNYHVFVPKAMDRFWNYTGKFGNILLSKYPFADTQELKFQVGFVSDDGKKRVKHEEVRSALFALIQLSKEMYIVFVTTHLEAWDSDYGAMDSKSKLEPDSIKINELKELNVGMKAFVDKHKSKQIIKVVVCGDYNVDPKTMKKYLLDHCPYLTQNLRLQIHPSGSTFCDGRTMDYIMTNDNTSTLKSLAYLENANPGEKWESDHALMFLDI
jgi:endonuclease/exonuclease/phosphatase family metal-dependent hydrolase